MLWSLPSVGGGSRRRAHTGEGRRTAIHEEQGNGEGQMAEWMLLKIELEGWKARVAMWFAMGAIGFVVTAFAIGAVVIIGWALGGILG